MEPALEVVLLPYLMSASSKLEIVCIGQRWEAYAEVVMIRTPEWVYAYEAGKVKVLGKVNQYAWVRLQ
jgi:hypothetical protein